MKAEAAEGSLRVLDPLVHGLREEHLAAMRRPRDTRCDVRVGAAIVHAAGRRVGTYPRAAGMRAHSDPNSLIAKGRRPCGGREAPLGQQAVGQRCLRILKGHEERVAGGLHLVPTKVREGRAHDLVVDGQRLAGGLAECVPHRGRAFDVAHHECDFAHGGVHFRHLGSVRGPAGD